MIRVYRSRPPRRWRRFAASILTLAAVWGSPAAAEEAPAVSPVPERDAVLGKMAAVIARNIARADTDHPVFHGCVDWHSAVHGHWALLRIARVAGAHADEAAAADRSMTAEGIAQEAADLERRPAFEMPYGRTWFLRLAVEHERWSLATGGKDPQRLRAMADAVARSLRDLYERRAPDPATREYANDAWVLVQLHDYFRHRGDESGLRRVGELVHKHFLGDAPALRFGADAETPEFFSRFGNWAYLVANTRDADTLGKFLDARRIGDEELRPIETPRPQAHHAGMNWSRAWALRALSRACAREADRRRFDRAFLEHVRVGLRQFEGQAKDDLKFGHWVPQFAVYALTEGEDRDPSPRRPASEVQGPKAEGDKAGK